MTMVVISLIVHALKQACGLRGKLWFRSLFHQPEQSPALISMRGDIRGSHICAWISQQSTLMCSIGPLIAQCQQAQLLTPKREKATTYGKPLGGVGVTGLGLELSGRFGPQLDDLLRRLAGYKRAIQTAAGRDAGRPLQAWRLAFSLALARFTAASYPCSNRCPASWHHHRQMFAGR